MLSVRCHTAADVCIQTQKIADAQPFFHVPVTKYMIGSAVQHMHECVMRKLPIDKYKMCFSVSVYGHLQSRSANLFPSFWQRCQANSEHMVRILYNFSVYAQPIQELFLLIHLFTIRYSFLNLNEYLPVQTHTCSLSRLYTRSHPVSLSVSFTCIKRTALPSLCIFLHFIHLALSAVKQWITDKGKF